MKPGPRVAALSEAHEGLELVAYKRAGDIWTLGRGHTRGVKEGDTCTQPQADAWLLEDVGVAADDVNREFPHAGSLTQGQFDALTAWAFQFGGKQLHASTMVKKLHLLDYAGAAKELLRWVYANGVISTDLQKRRATEHAWFTE